MKLSVLFMTDHGTHTRSNSLYSIVQACRRYHSIGKVYVASRTEKDNHAFFYENIGDTVNAIEASEHFTFRNGDFYYNRKKVKVPFSDIDIVWIRLPRPIPNGFFTHLTQLKDSKFYINNPLAITELGSKAFLLNFKSICPTIKLIHHREELIAFANTMDIVVKPLEEYGGRGIFRIINKKVEIDGVFYPLDKLDHAIKNNDYPVLGMEYLKNVRNGDKRIVIAGGTYISSSLRIPDAHSWLCNVAQGGHAEPSQLTQEEHNIIDVITPVLNKKGIYMAGIDTLEDNNGKRVLSELNTLSVGGVVASHFHTQEEIADKVVDSIWNHLIKNIYG